MCPSTCVAWTELSATQPAVPPRQQAQAHLSQGLLQLALGAGALRNGLGGLLAQAVLGRLLALRLRQRSLLLRMALHQVDALHLAQALLLCGREEPVQSPVRRPAKLQAPSCRPCKNMCVYLDTDSVAPGHAYFAVISHANRASCGVCRQLCTGRALWGTDS